eukprot:jgi/Botrbrau1/298/Bobra.0022s0264.1
MASWIQNQLKAAEDLLQAVDRTAQKVSNLRERDDRANSGFDTGPSSAPRSVGGSRVGQAPLRTRDGDSEVTGSKSVGRTPLKPLPPLPKAADFSSLGSEAATADPSKVSLLTPTNDERTSSSSRGQTEIVSQSVSFQPAAPEVASPIQPHQTREPERITLEGAGGKPPTQENNSVAEPTPETTLRPQHEHKPSPVDDKGKDLERVPSPLLASEAPAIVESSAAAVPTSNGQVQPILSPTTSTRSAGEVPVVKETWLSKEASSSRTLSLEERSVTEEQEATRSQDAGTSEDDGGGGYKVREARLVKMVDNLKRRLEQCRAENAQLEEMLRHADARASGGATDVERLEDALARADVARISAEAALSSGLAAKEVELEAARRQIESAKREAATLRGHMAALEENNQALIAERQTSEGQILQAMREEVSAVEARLEEERAAHARTRREFTAREQQMEVGVAESASALTEMQRNLSERTRKLDAAEARVTNLEASLASLQRENMTLRETAKQRGSAAQDGAGAVQEVAALKATCDQLRGAARSSQAAEAAAHAEAAAARREADALRQELAQASSNAVLEQQFKEVTDLLYLKQTQLEKLAADKAAQQLALERELALAREEAERVKRRAKNDRATANYSEGDVVVPMEAMGEAYYRLANNNRVGGAVKAAAGFMDASASTAVRVLKQYPLGRLVVFTYIVGVHLFIWLLLNRLQHKAFTVERGLGLDKMPE